MASSPVNKGIVDKPQSLANDLRDSMFHLLKLRVDRPGSLQ
jgi:hypothetical protein